MENSVENVNISDDLNEPTSFGENKNMSGSKDSTLDDKGRVNIPVGCFRNALQDGFVIAKNIDRSLKSLTIYTKEEWRIFYGKLRQLKQKKFNTAMRWLEHEEVEVKGGRFLVPLRLRKYAELNIKGEIVLIGFGDTAELWSRDLYGDGNFEDGDEDVFDEV